MEEKQLTKEELSKYHFIRGMVNQKQFELGSVKAQLELFGNEMSKKYGLEAGCSITADGVIKPAEVKTEPAKEE